MLVPTPAEVDVLKAYAVRKFGSDRLLQVALAAPIDAAVVVAPFDLTSFKTYRDERCGPALTAYASAVVSRVLWVSPQDMRPRRGASVVIGGTAPPEPTVDTLEASDKDPDPIRRVAMSRLGVLRATWASVDQHVAEELETAAGWTGTTRAAPLTEGNAPPGLSSEQAAALLEGKPAAGPGSLWSITSTSGLALVAAAPRVNVWHATQSAWADAQARKTGVIDSVLLTFRSLVAWSPEPFDGYLEAHPGYAEQLWRPLREMGGASAQASATFL
ncbi:MAG TPA: hypothetical protein VIM73_11635 [Polyangiaceae bacterium]